MPEVIDGEVTGLLVPPEHPKLLAEALQRLIASPGLRAALGASAARSVREKFSHHEIVGDLAQRFVASRGVPR